MVRRPVFNSLPARALLLVVLVGALVVTSPVFGRGTDKSQSTADQVVLVNQTFECSSYKQPVDFDLVKVTINAPTGRVDAIHTGPRCTGRIGRIEVDTWNADGVKIHPGTHDLVIEGGYVRCHGRVGAVHQDGIQAMGGDRVTLKNVTVDCATASNGALFIAQGAGGREVPTDIVCDGCTLMKGPTRNRVLRIATSIRSGARNSTIVWCGHGAGCGQGEAVWITGSAEQPIDSNNRYVLYSERGTTPPPTPAPTPAPRKALVLKGFTLSSEAPRPGARLLAQLGVSGLSSSGGVIATCRANVAGKAIQVLGKSVRSGQSRCAFAVPRIARPGLLTGVVGVTDDGSTVNRSFTVRVAEAGRPESSGRVTGRLQPLSSGVSLKSFVVSNQLPAAGAQVFAKIKLAGLGASKEGSLKCSGVAGGKALRVIGSGFKAADASCGWRIPAGVQGRPLRLSLSLVTPAGAIFTQSFRLNVRA